MCGFASLSWPPLTMLDAPGGCCYGLVSLLFLRDFYGVFPLKGKLLNVREATHQKIMKNEVGCSRSC